MDVVKRRKCPTCAFGKTAKVVDLARGGRGGDKAFWGAGGKEGRKLAGTQLIESWERPQIPRAPTSQSPLLYQCLLARPQSICCLCLCQKSRCRLGTSHF